MCGDAARRCRRSPAPGASSSRRPISAAPCRRRASRGAWCVITSTNLTEHDHVLLHELKADGGVDYMALPMHIRREGPLPVVTFATDSRLGFSDEDIADLTRLVDMMGAVTEMHIERSVAETVANTYLGPEVGQRVLNGAIRRGEGEELRAVLWFSDLRDFTGMNERLPAGEVLELLNNYLQLVGDALSAQRRRDPEIHRRRRDGLFPGRGCAVPAHGDRPGAGRGAPADRRHRGGQRGARRGRPRAAALRRRPACRRRDLRQCRHRGPARLHRHRPCRQSRLAAGRHDQGAGRAGAARRPSSTKSARCR